MVYLPRLTEGRFIDFPRLSFLNGQKSFSILEGALREREIPICPLLDSRMEAVNEMSKSLKLLSRTEKSIFEEGGSSDLHIAWLFAHGKFSDGTPVRCPLLLIPVDLIKGETHWLLRPREDGNISFNKSFLYAFSFHNHLPIREELMDEDFDERERDSTIFRTSIYQMLQKAGFEINFNPDNFRDELIPFTPYKKDEFEKNHRNGEIKLFPEAVLGIFPQADSYLQPDYEKLIASGKYNTIDDFFASRTLTDGNSGKKNFMMAIRESKLISIFQADQYQENALKAVKLGHSIVVEGPPGTGKSQLICNLISDAISNQKNVLVVSQKRAALDVVWSRMKTSGLEKFIALVHDFKGDRKNIYQLLATQIESLEEYHTKNNSLDAIQLERTFLTACNRIDQIVEELEDYRNFLFNEDDCGMSIKEMYLTSDRSAPIISLKQELHLLKMNQIGEFVSKLDSIASHRETLHKDGNLWDHRKSFAGFGIEHLSNIKKMLAEFGGDISRLSDMVKKATGLPIDFFQFIVFRNETESLNMLRRQVTVEDFPFVQRIFEEQQEDSGDLWLANIQRLMMSCFENDGLESSIPTEQLGKFQIALSRTLKARGNLIGWLRWELFSKDKFMIKRALVANNLFGRKGIKILEKKLDNRLNLEHNLSKLQEKEWTLKPPTDYSKQNFIDWFERTKKAITIRKQLQNIRGLVNYLSPATIDFKIFNNSLSTLIQATKLFSAYFEKWSVYFTLRQLQEIGAKPELVDPLIKYLDQHFDRICENDILMESLLPHERDVVTKIFDTIGEPNRQRSIDLFLNSLKIAWIDHQETRHPELRMVSSGKIEQLERELRELIVTKRNASKNIALLRARERMVEDIRFNRLNNMISFRDLYHQVSKKKKIWPLRKTISEYQTDVFKALPCWLASPESVSALFPLEEIFDIVIFDEASQCYAERGIPAISRGKQVIIAGDNKQLKPSDFYRTRWTEDEEEIDLEAESLLQLASRQLMTTSLHGHYRSRSPQLIEFSNRFFYKGKLQMLPDRLVLNQGEPAFDYIKVEGKWIDQTNREEADKIADLVVDLYNRFPEKEIGVITFNSPQQQLVLDCIEGKFTSSGIALPTSLMVKNIENVQGDEKDIIIFSVGYAPGKKDKIMLQFGSLNLVGGENRLNVAITRAREKIIVVASIWPHQLETDNTKNDGPRLLREYLLFVKTASELVGPVISAPAQDHNRNWYLKEKIAEKLSIDHPVIKDLFPHADLTTTIKNNYEQVIITDDEHYYQSLSPKFHYGLLKEQLEQKIGVPVLYIPEIFG